MALDKTSYLVLIYITTNNLLYKVFDNLRGRRKPTDYKLINLTNENFFLRISK
jgi:hypothetical protein